MDNTGEKAQDIKDDLAIPAECEVQRVSRKHLINLLNYINFQDGSVTVNFRHRRFGNILSFEARPLPCMNEMLECEWLEPNQIANKKNSFLFHNVVIPDGFCSVIIDAEPLAIRDDGITVRLLQSAIVSTSRAIRRYVCHGVECEIVQNGVVFQGKLCEFNSISFSIEVTAAPPQSFLWINSQLPLNLVIKNRDGVVYSGECMIIRHSLGTTTRHFVLKPVRRQTQRFKMKHVRSRRYALMPSPHIWFKHPMTNKTVHLVVDELSGSGFSVRESFDRSVLIAGLVIPKLALEITNGVTIECRAQVIYNAIDQISDEKSTQRCGIAFLDMGIQDQVKLANLLYQQQDENASVCANVDMDDLWHFFFEAGFIYPQKYAAISVNKRSFKDTYEKLYLRNPDIARHFVHLDKGRIQGHISMIHLHENTWLFHHHAADKRVGKRAGLNVLYQIGQYVNDFYNLTATHLHYVISYFRPDNRFPKKIFGGAKESINNPKGCSIDPFLFLHYHRVAAAPFDSVSALDGKGIALSTALGDDIVELNYYYEQQYGGLTLTALDLLPESSPGLELSEKYLNAGLMRKRFVYTVKKDGMLLAVFLLTITDFGLNLSNLTSSIHAFVLDPEELSAELFYAALNRLSEHFEMDEIPVLILGSDFDVQQSIPYEKIYNCWVINVPEAIDQYYLFVDAFLVRNQYNQFPRERGAADDGR